VTATRTIPLMQPYVPEAAIKAVERTLRTRWIGQGPQVEEFERQFSARVAGGRACVATGSCTDALHLAYLLAGIGPGDEVIAPLFTCTATNIPLLYCGAKIRFCDVGPDSLAMDVDHILRLITHRTQAIVTVHYGGTCGAHGFYGIPALAADEGISLIEDCAQSLGGAFDDGLPLGTVGDYSCFSFQAVKHITTGDGGMLMLRDRAQLAEAKRMRWFGIDRAAKLAGVWENDITEVGYKYQMTDVAAAMGLAGLDALDEQIIYRRALRDAYAEGLAGVDGIRLLDRDPESACWLCTIAVERREAFRRKLAAAGIESDQVHYRNDRYSIFKEFAKGCEFPNMDAIDGKYLVLPMHMGMELEDVARVCEVIRSGW
jgi:perosamine synthetase